MNPSKEIDSFIGNEILSEEIHADLVKGNDIAAIKTVINGKREVGYIDLTKEAFQKLEKHNIGVIPVRMTSKNTMTCVIYRNREKGFKLYAIAKSKGGFLNDVNPEEAREIGQLLGYNEKSINEYIEKKYPKKQVPLQSMNPDDYGDLQEQRLARNDIWGWVSPDDQFTQVPRLQHKGFIMSQYKGADFDWDYDLVFDTALKEGWVRMTYEYDQRFFKGSLTLTADSEPRVKQVFKHLFFDQIKYGHNEIYLAWEKNNGHIYLSTSTSDAKAKLINFVEGGLNEQNFKEFEKEILHDEKSHDLNKRVIMTLKDYEGKELKVCAVNCDFVRSPNGLDFNGFTDGGTYYVTSLPGYKKNIGKDEAWIDDVFLSKPNDLEGIILHEWTERDCMKYFHIDYDTAHAEYAEKAEKLYRKLVPDGVNMGIAQKIHDKFVEEAKKKKKSINENQQFSKMKSLLT